MKAEADAGETVGGELEEVTEERRHSSSGHRRQTLCHLCHPIEAAADPAKGVPNGTAALG